MSHFWDMNKSADRDPCNPNQPPLVPGLLRTARQTFGLRELDWDVSRAPDSHRMRAVGAPALALGRRHHRAGRPLFLSGAGRETCARRGLLAFFTMLRRSKGL